MYRAIAHRSLVNIKCYNTFIEQSVFILRSQQVVAFIKMSELPSSATDFSRNSSRIIQSTDTFLEKKSSIVESRVFHWGMFTKMGKQCEGSRIVSWVLYPSGMNNRTVGFFTVSYREKPPSHERGEKTFNFRLIWRKRNQLYQ